MKSHNKDKLIMRKLLLALVPYTRQNILLVFKPNQFFNDLELSSGYPKPKLRNVYNRAKRNNMISINDGYLKMSLKGRQIVQPYIAEKLSNKAQLMVIFDIPEAYSQSRQRFRNLLYYLEFKQIQKSVWMTDKDYRSIIFESINEYGLRNWVQLYEASKIII